MDLVEQFEIVSYLQKQRTPSTIVGQSSTRCDDVVVIVKWLYNTQANKNVWLDDDSQDMCVQAT